MTDKTDVTDQPGPSLDDIADIVARTNRGLLALERLVNSFFSFTSIVFGVIIALLLTRTAVAR